MWVGEIQPTFYNKMSELKPNIELMQAGLSDLAQMKVIDKECFPLDAWPLLELIAALILPGMVRIKAVVDGKMVGFVGGDLHRSDGVGWITTIGVLPQYQRFGIGSALLERCEKELGMPLVKLTVRRSNFGAQNLYYARGYEQVEVWKEYYEGGEDGLVLQKRM